MTASTHQYNYNRRNSHTTPYTVPHKPILQHHNASSVSDPSTLHVQPSYQNYTNAQANVPQHPQPSSAAAIPKIEQASPPAPPPTQSPVGIHSSQYPQQYRQQNNGARRDSHDATSAIASATTTTTHNSNVVPKLSREFVVRRISEGETGRVKEELRCEACGKGYKHISSLAKHLWEHTPEWNVTKKLLISKHQQVQLLEAASILVGMTNENGNHHSNEPMAQQRMMMMNARAPSEQATDLNSPFSPQSEHSAVADNNSSNTPTPPATAPNTQPRYESDLGGKNEMYQVKTDRDRAHSVSHFPPSRPRDDPISPLLQNNTIANGQYPQGQNYGTTILSHGESGLKSPTKTSFENNHAVAGGDFDGPIKTKFLVVEEPSTYAKKAKKA
ncbi:uncharacterized protein LODBEIA_P03180 [Lodderomyces beijingensis]|uniref:C2H2-type domain-containing protein n=1 Tax=Lodderomyces beijingensis TaxID=1775926 RepID=A0ABP0ZDY8_9ASCO